MAVSDGTTMMVMKDMGLVTQVFNDYKLASLVGHLAVGHNRYSTTGSSSWHNAQPMYRQAGGSEFAMGHNGNLTNTEELAASMGMLPGMVTSDSDLIAELVARELDVVAAATPGAGVPLESALPAVLPRVHGAFSLVLADRASLVGVRDPNGFRPLCLGKLDDGWVLASETPALDIIGAHFVREVEPGEVHRHQRRRLPEPAALAAGAGPAQAVLVRVRVPGPAGQPPLRPGATRCPRPHGRAAGRAGSRGGRHGRRGAGLRHAGGRGLQPAQRRAVRSWAGEEPLYRSHFHQP